MLELDKPECRMIQKESSQTAHLVPLLVVHRMIHRKKKGDTHTKGDSDIFSREFDSIQKLREC